MLQQVQIKNFKNFAQAVVNLKQFTVLVGPNGAGKSNLVDSLRFVKECVTHSVSLALQSRGGIAAVRRRSRGHPTHFGMRLVFALPDGQWADYSFEIAAQPRETFIVKQERCRVQSLLGASHSYKVENGRFTKEVSGVRPKIEPDRLALTILSAADEFRPMYDYLSRMQFYSLVPDRIRALQDPDSGEILKGDGSNAAAVLREIRDNRPQDYERICSLLSKVVPDTVQAEYLSLGQKETLRFKQNVGDRAPWTFGAISMSDGTLRVLGVLLAVYQVAPCSFVAIEEPEATIHPAALEVLVDILKDGAQRTQVLITTHSHDILDNKSIGDNEIIAVFSEKGKATVAPIKLSSRELIKKRLYTAGELLRSDELEPDPVEAESLASKLNLFGAVRTP